MKFTKGADRLGLPEEQRDRIEVCWSKGEARLVDGKTIKPLGWEVWDGVMPEEEARRPQTRKQERLAQVKEILGRFGRPLTTTEIVDAMRTHKAAPSTVRADLDEWSGAGGPLVKSRATRGFRFWLAPEPGEPIAGDSDGAET